MSRIWNIVLARGFGVDDRIEVLGHPGFAVGHRGDATRQAEANPDSIEHPDQFREPRPKISTSCTNAHPLDHGSGRGIGSILTQCDFAFERLVGEWSQLGKVERLRGHRPAPPFRNPENSLEEMKPGRDGGSIYSTTARPPSNGTSRSDHDDTQGHAPQHPALARFGCVDRSGGRAGERRRDRCRARRTHASAPLRRHLQG